MYCEKCQKYYESNKKFCSECGSRLVDELDIYAKQLLDKDESAFDKIYNDTKVWVMKKVSMQLFNEQDRLDCTQEIYLKLFKKIDLFNPEKGKFRPWFNTLVSNQIIDFIRKTMDEPEYESDEEMLNQLADPTTILESEPNECTRLLRNIIDSLPQEQKICVERFYIEGKRRKEVADILGLSEETIKSRLRLARKKIENKILELEKAGTKIYGLSPFAFFLLLNAKEKAEKADYALLYSNIMKKVNLTEQITLNTAMMCKENIGLGESSKVVTEDLTATPSVGQATATAGKTVAATAGKAAIHKVAIALIATAIVGGSGVAVYTHQKENTKNAVVESNKQVKEKEYSENELQVLLKDIDMDYLESIMLVAPYFSDINDIDESELYSIPFISAIRKFSNTISGEDYYKMGNLINDNDVIKVEHSSDYQSGYIFLKKNSFDSVFSILQHKFDENKCANGEYIFIKNDQIKIDISANNELYETIRASNIETNIDSENQEIIIEYDFEVSYFDSGKKYIDDTYVVVLSPAENKFGYVMKSKESKSDYVKRTEEEKRMKISDEELEKLADSLDMDLLTVLLSNYTDSDKEIPMENIFSDLVVALYSCDNSSENDKKIYDYVKNELSIVKDMNGHDFTGVSDEWDRVNIVLSKKAIETIGYLFRNEKILPNQLWQDENKWAKNNVIIVKDDEVAINMMDNGYDFELSSLIKFIKKTINKENKQIELEYNMPFESETKTYDWKMKAIIVPSSSDVGYTIQSVESIGYLSENELKKIASDLNVPEQLDITFSQGYPSYWDAAGIYDFAVDVICEGEIIASTNIDLESGEMTRGTLMYDE